MAQGEITYDLSNVIQAHLTAKIEAAKLEHFPFPHMIIEQALPDPIYKQVLALNPFQTHEGTPWVAASRARAEPEKARYSLRKQIDLARLPQDMESGAKVFWVGLQQTLAVQSWFQDALIAKYWDYFVLRFGELIKDPKFKYALKRDLFIQRHEPGYKLGPHSDLPTRVYTAIFSFAQQGGYEDFGTEIYRPKNPYLRCWGRSHHDVSKFSTAGIAPYKPNNLFVFFKTRQSFHGVREITDKVPAGRFGMQLQAYEPEDGLFEDLSFPGLLSVREA